MRDPDPSNIVGEKVYSHVFEHSIRWDFLLGILVAAYVAHKIFSGTGSGSGSGSSGVSRHDGGPGERVSEYVPIDIEVSGGKTHDPAVSTEV